MFYTALLIGFRQIRRELRRTVLTVLGIVIGVGSIITMVTLGKGGNSSVQAQVDRLGTNMLVIKPGAAYGSRAQPGNSPNFMDRDAVALREQVPGIAAVAPVRTATLTTIYRDRSRYTSIEGTTAEFFPMNNWHIAAGRLPNEEDYLSGNSVCVIGETVRKELFGSVMPVGDKIRLAHSTCEIIGVLAPKGQILSLADQDDLIVVPLSTMRRRLVGRASISDLDFISVQFLNGADASSVTASIKRMIHARRSPHGTGDDNFNIFDAREVSKQLTMMTSALTALLAAVATISLLVAGVGIMNIMLFTVTERTKEIGIRVSIGAKRGDILWQFVLESVTLCSVGGAVGIAGAFLICFGICHLVHIPFLFNLPLNLMAFLFAVVVGVVFGLAPARRASRLDPIDALRHE